LDSINPDLGILNPAPQVWPPPPTNATVTFEASPLSGTESFRVQNYWLVLLLTLVTLGIYAVFWLKRQIAVIDSRRPDLKVGQTYANVVLTAVFLNLGLAIASGFSDSQMLEGISRILSRVVGIMVLALLFQVKNGMNMMLRLQRGSPYWFAGVYTWLFGVAYQQYKINQNARRWQNESLRAANSIVAD
jgi:hypothetical protein